MKSIEEIRRERLKEVVDAGFDGYSGRLADAVKRPRPNISQILAGKRPFGEMIARDIEHILDLGRGYLDREADDTAALSPDDQRFLRMVSEAVLTREVPQHMRDTILTILGSAPAKSQDAPQQMAA